MVHRRRKTEVGPTSVHGKLQRPSIVLSDSSPNPLLPPESVEITFGNIMAAKAGSKPLAVEDDVATRISQLSNIDLTGAVDEILNMSRRKSIQSFSQKSNHLKTTKHQKRIIEGSEIDLPPVELLKTPSYSLSIPAPSMTSRAASQNKIVKGTLKAFEKKKASNLNTMLVTDRNATLDHQRDDMGDASSQRQSTENGEDNKLTDAELAEQRQRQALIRQKLAMEKEERSRKEDLECKLLYYKMIESRKQARENTRIGIPSNNSDINYRLDTSGTNKSGDSEKDLGKGGNLIALMKAQGQAQKAMENYDRNVIDVDDHGASSENIFQDEMVQMLKRQNQVSDFDRMLNEIGKKVEFARIIAANGTKSPSTPKSGRDGGRESTVNSPVHRVSEPEFFLDDSHVNSGDQASAEKAAAIELLMANSLLVGGKIEKRQNGGSMVGELAKNGKANPMAGMNFVSLLEEFVNGKKFNGGSSSNKPNGVVDGDNQITANNRGQKSVREKSNFEPTNAIEELFAFHPDLPDLAASYRQSLTGGRGGGAGKHNVPGDGFLPRMGANNKFIVGDSSPSSNAAAGAGAASSNNGSNNGLGKRRVKAKFEIQRWLNFLRHNDAAKLAYITHMREVTERMAAEKKASMRQQLEMGSERRGSHLSFDENGELKVSVLAEQIRHFHDFIRENAVPGVIDRNWRPDARLERIKLAAIEREGKKLKVLRTKKDIDLELRERQLISLAKHDSTIREQLVIKGKGEEASQLAIKRMAWAILCVLGFKYQIIQINMEKLHERTIRRIQLNNSVKVIQRFWRAIKQIKREKRQIRALTMIKASRTFDRSVKNWLVNRFQKSCAVVQEHFKEAIGMSLMMRHIKHFVRNVKIAQAMVKSFLKIRAARVLLVYEQWSKWCYIRAVKKLNLANGGDSGTDNALSMYRNRKNQTNLNDPKTIVKLEKIKSFLQKRHLDHIQKLTDKMSREKKDFHQKMGVKYWKMKNSLLSEAEMDALDQFLLQQIQP